MHDQRPRAHSVMHLSSHRKYLSLCGGSEPDRDANAFGE
jgi:hypothetical protein